MKKTMLILGMAGAFVLGTMLISGCGNSEEQHDHEATHEHHEGEVHAHVAYQCPMKCEDDKTYEEKGTCPVCKMDLVKLEEHSEGGHQH
ncbi:MAG: hypothetical protein IIA88_09125 [Bacteroidetes bacterium]|nr:hypothetical protein [Bacteroidota bacterium]